MNQEIKNGVDVRKCVNIWKDCVKRGILIN